MKMKCKLPISNKKKALLEKSALSTQHQEPYSLKEYFPKNLEDVEYPDEFRPHDKEVDDPWEGYDDGE